MKYLFKTIVGSTLWKMNSPNSDVDYFGCYKGNTDAILIGKTSAIKSYFVTKPNGENYDESIYEIGTILHELLKGNINFLIGVFGNPVINGKELQFLKTYMEEHPTKNFFKSINGMALSNYRKYVLSGKDMSQKRLNLIAKYLTLGITYLNTGKIEFKQINIKKFIEISYLLDDLLISYNNSKLPEKNDESELEKFLLKIRKEN